VKTLTLPQNMAVGAILGLSLVVVMFGNDALVAIAVSAVVALLGVLRWRARRG